MPLLEDMVTFLTNKGLVEGDGVDAFRDFQPESPDNIVSLHEYSGDPVSTYTDVVHRSVQVIVRDKSANNARARATGLCTVLRKNMNNIGRINFTPKRWGQVHIRQTPFKLSQDESGRTLYCFNLGITTDLE